MENYLTDFEKIREECIKLRKEWTEYSTWKGISCASKYSNVLKQFYFEELPKLGREFIGEKMYYFNDQAVVKMPNDGMVFLPHYDNFYGPNRDGKIHTVNLLLILDDITKENGSLKVSDLFLYPKAGDIVAINGNTIHGSGENKSEHPRVCYACVYTESPIQLKGFYNDEVR